MTEPEPLVDQVIRAHNEIVRLCTTREGWRMSVPANPMRDSDLILSNALTSLDTALAAAVERATRAEAERDEALRQADEQSRDADRWFGRMQAAEAHLAKVREGFNDLPRLLALHWFEYIGPDEGFDCGCNERGNLGPFPTVTECAAHLTDVIRAALGSVGATEGEAAHDHGEWSKDEQRYEDGCKTDAPASPAAAEPERACPICGGRYAPDEKHILDHYTDTPAEPTRADEPRACPRPEAHHYQPEAKP